MDVARRLVISCGWGVLSGDDLLVHCRALRADPLFRPSFSQLIDLRGVTELAARAPAIRAVAGENPFGSGARRAILVSSDVAFGMARMYQLLTDETSDESQVFRDQDLALAWLGLAGDAAPVLLALATLPATSARWADALRPPSSLPPSSGVMK